MLATPISGPALMCTPQSVSLDIELPTVFVMPTVRARRSLQYLKAMSVSAVSPGKHAHLHFRLAEIIMIPEKHQILHKRVLNNCTHIHDEKCNGKQS